MAGTGKSTIANTVSKILDETDRLGASYCFSRDDRIHRNAENFFSTIAVDMAQVDKLFRRKLFEATEDKRYRSSSMPSLYYFDQCSPSL
jgi:hypothetical protein